MVHHSVPSETQPPEEQRRHQQLRSFQMYTKLSILSDSDRISISNRGTLNGKLLKRRDNSDIKCSRFPEFQQGKKISIGRELDDDTGDGTSFLGAKAADWAAEKMMSLRELCRWMRSPLPLQPT